MSEAQEGGDTWVHMADLLHCIAEIRFNLGSGRSPGEGNGNPLQYSCLENPMDTGPGSMQSMGLQRARHD